MEILGAWPHREYDAALKSGHNNDQHFFLTKYDYYSAVRLFQQIAKINPCTQLYNPAMSNIPEAWVTSPQGGSKGDCRPYFNIMKFFSKSSHLAKEPWWGPKDPWNPEVGLRKRLLKVSPVYPKTEHVE